MPPGCACSSNGSLDSSHWHIEAIVVDELMHGWVIDLITFGSVLWSAAGESTNS